jgi:hypothetical protein
MVAAMILHRLVVPRIVLTVATMSAAAGGSSAVSNASRGFATAQRGVFLIPTRKQLEGGGFPVRRPPVKQSGIGGLIMLFDHMGPMTLKPGEVRPATIHESGSSPGGAGAGAWGVVLFRTVSHQ